MPSSFGTTALRVVFEMRTRVAAQASAPVSASSVGSTMSITFAPRCAA